jgi:sugar-specific transcriptional regulator TrmB
MTLINTQEASTKLMDFGFTQLESEIYLFLLINGPGTGYGIAKGINKAIANVYKAIESLSVKGGVIFSSSGSKICSPIPWKQLLASKKKQYMANLSSLSQELERLPEQQENEQVHQLMNRDQLMEQSIRIIESAQSVLIMDLQPGSIEWFESAILAAVKRGVEVRAKVYEETTLEGVILTIRENGKDISDKTKDTEFTICSDGRECIMALLSRDGKVVHQALQSKSALMNMKIYSGLLYELILTDIKQFIPSGDLKSAQTLLKNTAHLHPFSTENIVFQQYKTRYSSNSDD